jgi:hypothetical protein
VKYLLIAYFAFTVPSPHWGTPELIDEFEGEVAYKQCIHSQGINRFMYKDDPSVYIVCIQSAEI